MVEISASPFRPPLTEAFEQALAYLNRLPSAPVAPTADLAAVRARLSHPLCDEGIPAEQVIAELARDVEAGLVGCAGGRFFAWVIGGALPAALAADWLTAAWDQNASLYATGPAAAVAEEVAGAWLKEIFGLPAAASFAFVTGCQMAHVTCLAAARHRLLARRGWDVEQRGLAGAPPISIFTSCERHGTVERAVRLLGVGKQHLIDLPSDSHGRLERQTLERALTTHGDGPAIVLLQAGDLKFGAYDPFESLIPLAHKYGAWVHIDGAFGLWAAASPRYRHLLRGVEHADSWATDGHKWLNVPYDSGYAFVADAEAHRASMSHRASYLTHAEEARDQMDWNPESSRRARGFTTYAALRELGRNGIADLVDRSCLHAHALVTQIGSLPGAEVLAQPIINQGLVRFLDTRPGATDADHDRRTNEVIDAICAGGVAFFGGVTWRGRRAMRVSVCNWLTTDDDVVRVVRAVQAILARRSPDAPG
ncbi:MAG TPA: aminotransferase class V-fold PLP-dependent enzyme [Bryobacteraceae bacterium]|nr:aminotransferase class V-fold PLP-dependent enzyme [Bryobacteraceae bacterium]